MSDSLWSIAVKTVGGKHVDAAEDFSVSVSPDDDLAKLHHQIEHVTGLKAEQQRLIYRGRLISSGGGSSSNDEEEESAIETKKEHNKVRDVVGLCDGQTIHLVPKRENEQAAQEEETTDESRNSDDNAASSSSDNMGRSLLATLLGLGSLDPSDDDDDATSSPSMRRLRASRNRRRTSHRLTQEDIVVPDPGTMEPVRQGLMTLHTMLDTTPTEHPWDASRQWYRGQWVDCRDTVNQWLEATVVDIAHPDDVLPERTLVNTRRRRTTQPVTDDAVSANDYEGRRNLLLESDGEGGLCERQNNHGVHLLLIHYNGWPHRWDEWIRSDSERLRPFRTRTRHNPTSGALPAPQSVFDGAPSTNIKEDDEEGDRSALLPELGRTMASVNDLLQEVVTNSQEEQESAADARANSDLPWLTDVNDYPSAWSSESRPRYDRRQLEALAPLLDRLGRALTDAAPHVSSFAATLPYDDEAFPALSTTDPENNVIVVGETVDGPPPPPPPVEETTTTGTGFFSLLSRGESRSRATSAPGRWVEAYTDDEPDREEEPEQVNPDYVDFVNGMINTTRGEARSGRRNGSDDGASLLGAYLALSSLASESGSNNNNGSGGSGGSGLLGRLLRERGNNNDGGGGDGTAGGGGGPAIDIHIHAIVTGPGVGPGAAMGMAMLPGAPPSPPLVPANPTPNSNNISRRLFSSRRGGDSSDLQQAASPAADEDDMGIFAELYSENPSPLDPNDNVNASDEADGDDLVVASAIHEDGAEDQVAAPATSRPSQGRSPSHPATTGTPSSQQRNRRSPRRSSTIGRVLRGVIGQNRRRTSSARDADSESL